MAKSRQKKGPSCKTVRVRGERWYCCCGRKQGDTSGTTYCACAPMVGKDRVDTRRQVKFRVRKDGKACRGHSGPCKPRKGLG